MIGARVWCGVLNRRRTSQGEGFTAVTSTNDNPRLTSAITSRSSPFRIIEFKGYSFGGQKPVGSMFDKVSLQ